MKEAKDVKEKDVKDIKDAKEKEKETVKDFKDSKDSSKEGKEGKETNTAGAEEGFWSIVVGAAAEESVKSGSVVKIDQMLKKEGIRPAN